MAGCVYFLWDFRTELPYLGRHLAFRLWENLCSTFMLLKRQSVFRLDSKGGEKYLNIQNFNSRIWGKILLFSYNLQKPWKNARYSFRWHLLWIRKQFYSIQGSSFDSKRNAMWLSIKLQFLLYNIQQLYLYNFN